MELTWVKVVESTLMILGVGERDSEEILLERRGNFCAHEAVQKCRSAVVVLLLWLLGEEDRPNVLKYPP